MSQQKRWARWTLGGSIGLVAYTYVGYPAILAGLHRLRPRREAPELDPLPTVTLIVAAFDEEESIARRIENLRELDYPSDLLDILVVTDGSSDRTAAIAEGARVRVLHRPERAGKASALNRGVEGATGEILVFSDANNAYTSGTVRALLAPFADPAVGVVSGSKRITEGTGRALDEAEGAYWRYEDALKRWESSLGSVTGVAGEVLAMRREVYTPLEGGTVNDDFTLAIRAAIDGWRIAYAPDAVSVERASASLGDEETRRSRIVAGRYQALRSLLPQLVCRRPMLAWQVVSHKGLRPLVPFAMILAGLSNLALARSSPLGRAALGLQAAFYALAGLGAELDRRGRRSMLSYLPYYLCRVNLAALRGVLELRSGRDLSLWTRVARSE